MSNVHHKQYILDTLQDACLKREEMHDLLADAGVWISQSAYVTTKSPPPP